MPWPFDAIGGTVRSVLGASERAEAEMAHVASIGELEARLDEAVAAIHRASESLERHVEVLGALSDSLPALTASVTRLTDELGHAMEVTAPIAAAEREASRLDRLLRRRGPKQTPPAEPAPGPADEAPGEPEV